MNNNECPYCKNKRYKKLYSTNVSVTEAYDLLKCTNCSGIRLSPMPSDERQKTAYDLVYYGSGKKKFPGLIGIIFDYLQSTRYRKFCDYLPVGATVLDVGCGSGTFVEELIRLGYDCSGVELPGPAARRAAKIRGLKLYVGMLEDVTLPKKEFDFVVLWHVFEHLKDPRFAVNVIQGVLRENGTLVIALPNIQSLQSRIFKGYWFHIDPPRHLFFFDSNALKSEMQNIGFKFVKQTTWSTEYNTFGILQSFLNLFMRRRDFLYDIIKKQVEEKAKIDLYIRVLLLIYVICVAPVAFFLAIFESVLGYGGSLTMVFRKEGEGG